MGEAPRTQYARNGDLHLAYQVVGEGALDLFLIDTWVHHVEAVWDFPDFARFLRRLSSFGRLIHFDRRGTGLSDPVPPTQLPSLDEQVGDAMAVMRAAGSQEAVLIGINDGTIIALLLAAQHPDLCRSLILFTLTKAHSMAGGMPMESIDAVIEMIEKDAVAGTSGVEMLAPSRVGDAAFDRHLARLQRYAVRRIEDPLPACARPAPKSVDLDSRFLPGARAEQIEHILRGDLDKPLDQAASSCLHQRHCR